MVPLEHKKAPRSSGGVTEPDFAAPAACEARSAARVARPKAKEHPVWGALLLLSRVDKKDAYTI